MPVKPGPEIDLAPLDFERLSRLRCELALAESRVELARERFERGASDVARVHGQLGAFTIDFEHKKLVLNPPKEQS